MKRAYPADDDDIQKSPQKKNAAERSSSQFPLRLSGIIFDGEATDHDVDGNPPAEVGQYVETSPPSVDLPPRSIRWSTEHDAYVYRLAKPFTFTYHRGTIEDLADFPEEPDCRAIFWGYRSSGQRPKLFLHPAVSPDPNDMDNTWPYEAWLLHNPEEGEMDYDRKDLWAVRVALSPVETDPEDFVDYEYDVQATIDEVYVREAFFDLPPKRIWRIEEEIEEYKQRASFSRYAH
ncbi:hypothetical protein CVT26_005381 [Gymnopilus dilepis]|uniref:Uncharacterized protein n=1 Tax=Gymnopilus dilepis TaxID=231916 RepID=A0A409WBZ6_9AGAR|nr:hypothetical protein CVT26_005381 [Gymnopilus dilepis]